MLENVYHEFEKNEVKFREYRIDTHPTFANFTPKISILCEKAVWQLILIRQNERCFKQYSFSHKCWTGTSGEMKLLLKSDGRMWIISTFVSRDFWVELIVSDEEMKLINERKRSNKCNHYVSKKEAIEVHGTSR